MIAAIACSVSCGLAHSSASAFCVAVAGLVTASPNCCSCSVLRALSAEAMPMRSSGTVAASEVPSEVLPEADSRESLRESLVRESLAHESLKKCFSPGPLSRP